MTKILNFFAGPGAGKSTLAADVFAEFKWRGENCELINEYAKEVTWDGHHNLLKDQLFVSANQNRRLLRCHGQVDYIITDSPLIICLAYIDENFPASFKQMILDTWNSYDNINYWVRRKKKYNPIGRNQDEEEARELDSRIAQICSDNNIDLRVIDGDRDARFKIANELLG